MTEMPGFPVPPPATIPKKTNPWIIAILVLVVLCCGCFGVVGLLVGFWEPIRQELGLSALAPILQGLM
jgi:hypothetical protein